MSFLDRAYLAENFRSIFYRNKGELESSQTAWSARKFCNSIKVVIFFKAHYSKGIKIHSSKLFQANKQKPRLLQKSPTALNS